MPKGLFAGLCRHRRTTPTVISKAPMAVAVSACLRGERTRRWNRPSA